MQCLLIYVMSSERSELCGCSEASPLESIKRAAIPMAMLASRNEPADLVKAFHEAQTTPELLETFPTQTRAGCVRGRM